ncbi:MAG TPA: hypothetical protein VHK67_04030 [Rhabdochlamydiaceae bacterium]|nr:hypothetical protein [Rhabdochlamydiaceae bacterium]
MTIGRNLSYGKSLLPTFIAALHQATIDKSYLTWLDINKLLQAFPQHVNLIGDAVIFKGPVAIVSSISSAERHGMQWQLAVATGLIFLLCASYTVFLNSVVFHKKKPLSMRNFIVVASMTLAGGMYAFVAAGHSLPTQPGVYFPGQPPFLP